MKTIKLRMVCLVRLWRSSINAEKYVARGSYSLFLLFFFILFAAGVEASEDQPPLIGNFILPASKQPAPLISFGENILDKNETQLSLFVDDYAGVNSHYIDVIPGLLYGITSNLSLFVNVPYAASYQANQKKSTGFEDLFAQLEYAFYNGSSKNYVDQATVVVNLAAPTGSIHKVPATGVGSLSYFLGATFNRTYVNWFLFASPGGLFTTAKNGTKFGNNYLYQFGFGRNIAAVQGWLLAWMTEIDGTYAQRNRVQGVIDPDSGGNKVYVTPSLWVSTKKMIVQFGVGYAVAQHLNGSQTRDTFLVASNLAWNIF